MLLRWMAYALWRPFESLCHRLPLIPLRAIITEPVEGVKCIQIGNFLTRALGAVGGYGYSTCYLIDDELLVDTGFGWAARCFHKILRQLDAPSRLKTVVCTHYHEDHIGNNDLIASLTQATILAHRDALAEVRHPLEKAWYRRFLFGPVGPTEAAPLPRSVSTARRQFEVLELAGHCPGHVGLLETERGWLFSGDLFISVDLDSQLADANGPAWIRSLEAALAKKPTMLLDGHGAIVSGEAEVRQALSDKLEFLRSLRSRIQDALSHGPATIQQITRRVFGSCGLTNQLSFSEGWLALLTGTDFSRSNLVRTFVADVIAEQQG